MPESRTIVTFTAKEVGDIVMEHAKKTADVGAGSCTIDFRYQENGLSHVDVIFHKVSNRK